MTCEERASFPEVQETRREAESIINSDWHYSWHWERDQWGNELTLKGWRKALEDGEQMALNEMRHLAALLQLLPRIRSIVKQMELEETNE